MSAQNLLLVLSSGITSGGAWVPYGVLGIEPRKVEEQRECDQGKRPTCYTVFPPLA